MSGETFRNGRITLHAGDCRDVVRTLADCSVDAVVTDPPYGFNFMGKKWDTGQVAFDAAFWREVLRVLRPGGHCVAFGGDRTYHRLAVAIEDAGFEVRQSCAWIFGQGFPKSLNVSKAIDKAAGVEREVVGFDAAKAAQQTPKHGTNALGDFGGNAGSITAPATDAAKQWAGLGTALKPAMELICLARKPLSEGTISANVLRWGTGALNIDATRIETNEDQRRPSRGGENGLAGTSTFKIRERQVEDQVRASGRWPANVCLSYPEDEYVLRDNITQQQRQEVLRFLHDCLAASEHLDAALSVVTSPGAAKNG